MSAHLKIEGKEGVKCAHSQAEFRPALSVTALDNAGQVEGKDEQGGARELGLNYPHLQPFGLPAGH
jgi:hypothetical protein